METFHDETNKMKTAGNEAEKNLATLVAYQAASNRSCTQVASGHEDYVKASEDELKAWGNATKALEPETLGSDRRVRCSRRVHLLVRRHGHFSQDSKRQQ